MRGGLGVRKRLSEESLRDSYRLNGVQTGSAVVRAHDKYFADFTKGFDVGVLVRKTASVVTIHWMGDDEATHYSQGDARYEVDRGRWRFLGPVQGNPLDPNNPLAEALTKLRGSYRVPASAIDADSTDRGDEDMAQRMSNAAAEREAAKKAIQNGEYKERETYTAKQIAGRCGTDAKTMRKFFRSSHSTVEPVGQGGRYEFDAADLPKIQREFTAWRKKAESRGVTPKPTVPITEVMDQAAEQYTKEKEAEEAVREHFAGMGETDHEPTAEEIEEMMRLEAELGDDDLELDD